MKKDIERFYLEEFIRVYNWNASIISAGNDSGKEPDFFVDLAGEKVGVEITQLFKKKNRKGNPEKANEKHNERFLSDLADAYYSQSSIPINMSLLSRNSLQYESIPELAVRLANESERIVEKQKIRIEFDKGTISYIQRLPDSLRQYRRWTFVNDHGGFSKPISIAILNEAITPKYQKVKNYKATVNKVFLLVYADRTWGSGLMHIDSPLLVEHGGYDAIFLYLYPEQIHILANHGMHTGAGCRPRR